MDVLFYIGYVALACSLVLYYKKSSPFAFGALILSVLAFGIYSIQVYDFLLPWDERFHALVAKNTAVDFLKPTLYKEDLLNMHTSAWYNTHIWLHKQPWFTWQMALSIHFFGSDLWAMRLPSLLMLLLIVTSIYFGTKKISAPLAFPLALMAALQPVFYNLISGRQGMEHNDIAFVAWVTFSFWGVIEMLKSTEKWPGMLMLVIGTTAAILTKWLAGGLVFATWFFYLLLTPGKKRKDWLYMLLGILLVTVLVSPWYLYTFSTFPDTAKAEWAYNGKHLFEVVEDHAGSWKYHFEVWGKMLSPIAFFFLIAVAIHFIFQRKNMLSWCLMASVFIVFGVFSLAKTKLEAYTFLAIGPAIFSMGSVFSKAIQTNFIFKRFMDLIMLCSIVFFVLRIGFDQDNPYFLQLKKEKVYYTSIAKKLPEKAVLFNVPEFKHIEIMYYADCIAYDLMPSQEQIDLVKTKGYTPVFVDNGREDIPSGISETYMLVTHPD